MTDGDARRVIGMRTGGRGIVVLTPLLGLVAIGAWDLMASGVAWQVGLGVLVAIAEVAFAVLFVRSVRRFLASMSDD